MNFLITYERHGNLVCQKREENLIYFPRPKGHAVGPKNKQNLINRHEKYSLSKLFKCISSTHIKDYFQFIKLSCQEWDAIRERDIEELKSEHQT